ncbi:hypothetical protein IGB42_02063 [Andreprevotia sp. IGB-42]|uniref:DUF4255 domain-containing protein n=1 Tax=Andreprevotia sp. IGB-42 TaxID=2497473 RepID=UPI001356E971|nr:DUF4255 domain-containing protein [Andreprevotia sp. IGB-42]KAF0813710.1 hypothetical protein IGB42_02063 [Andreprevotia sp. IGB-42]
MALLDLSLVSKTIISLLEKRLPLYADWPASATLVASPAPPDLVTGDYALSFYLYHLREDAHTKSQDWQTGDGTPQRYKPMGLTLNYVLCPRSNMTDAGKRTYVDQLLMGLGVKTLHDFPLIDDNTMVDDGIGGLIAVMPLALRGQGNKLRITLRPTPAEEASQYWQSGTQAMRLAAYFEVSATLLEPEELKSRSTRVLSVGVHTLVRGKAVIDGTRNTVQFALPGDPAVRELQVSPAEAAFGQQVSVYGSDLKGDVTSLLLNHPDFDAPVVADAAWAVSTDGSILTATLQPTASGQPLLPGIYTVLVKTVSRFKQPDGSTRDFDSYSNPAPLAIAPGIISIGFTGGGLGTIKLDGFDPTTLEGNALQCIAGTERLQRVNTAPAAGQFRPRTGPDRLEFRLPAGISPGTAVPLRVIVRNAESAPHWGIAP